MAAIDPGRPTLALNTSAVRSETISCDSFTKGSWESPSRDIWIETSQFDPRYQILEKFQCRAECRENQQRRRAKIRAREISSSRDNLFRGLTKPWLLGRAAGECQHQDSTSPGQDAMRSLGRDWRKKETPQALVDRTNTCSLVVIPRAASE
jgi:hypothetical protein